MKPENETMNVFRGPRSEIASLVRDAEQHIVAQRELGFVLVDRSVVVFTGDEIVHITVWMACDPESRAMEKAAETANLLDRRSQAPTPHAGAGADA